MDLIAQADKFPLQGEDDFCYHDKDQILQVPVQVMDTTGAGDKFN
ncbi:hypothetical protein [Sporosarcina sp. P18a]|nr:hypothetical protein [Sporosarcina sp. P18a]